MPPFFHALLALKGWVWGGVWRRLAGMRGESQHVTGLPQAVALLDLVLGGVSGEMGSEIFNWQEALAAKAGIARATLVADVVLPKVESVVKVVPVEVQAEVRVEVPGEVWVEGEAGGVLLLVQGDKPDARSRALASAMLAAAGLRDVKIGWVGVVGKVVRAEVLAAMQGLVPQQVLVLGQGPLGVLLGRNLGVEGWHAAGGGLIDGWDGVVGVTYPLELLLKQPLFKRLAWQHLLAWGDFSTGQGD